MNLQYHFVACAVLSALLWPFFGISSLLVFLTGFLIDIDHYFWYFAKGTRYPKEVFSKIKSGNRGPHIDVFHTIEFAVVLAGLSWLFLPGFFAILMLSLAVHYAMDRLFAWRNYSVALWLWHIKNGNKWKLIRKPK